MGQRDRDTSGQYTERVSLEDVLEVFDEVRGPSIISSDVAEQYKITTEAARQKLAELYDRGDVDRRKAGGTTLWWHTGDEPITEDERAGDATATDTSPEPSTREPERDLEEPDPLEAVDFPAGRDREECREAVYAAREYLREEGRASKREIVESVMPEHALGYDVPDLDDGTRYRGAWWRRVVKPGLQALEDVEKPPPGGSDWRYTGADTE